MDGEVTCKRCEQPALFRFCSNACFLSYVKDPRRAHVLCAICQYDPITKRIGNHETHRRCEDCAAGEENTDWAQPSEYEQGSDDVDALAALAGSSFTLSTLASGKRKEDTELTRLVTAIFTRGFKSVKRRRRNANGYLLRGWVECNKPLSLRDIAEEAGCSQEYVRMVIARIFS